jgi:hypothetical protein
LNCILKTTLLLTLLCAGNLVIAQKTNPADTLPRKDTLLKDVKEGALDNIPIVSLDENDLGDGGS